MKYPVLIILTLSISLALAGEMTVTIPLDASVIEVHETGIYTRVTGDNMGTMGTLGHPALPEFTARIALPTGCRATGIEILSAEYSGIRGRFTVLPATEPQPVSVEREIPQLRPDPQVYGSDASYPDTPLSFHGSQLISGRIPECNGSDCLSSLYLS